MVKEGTLFAKTTAQGILGTLEPGRSIPAAPTYFGARHKHLEVREVFKRSFFPAVFCFMLLASWGQAQTVSQLFNDAKSAEAAGKTDRAFLLHRQIVRQYPDSQYAEESLFFIAKYHYDSRNYLDAEQTFSEHVRRFPNSRFRKDADDFLARIRLRSLKERADALFEEGKLEPASILYKQYLEIDPANAEVKVHLEQITKTLQQVHFGFEQLQRERSKLEQEKADVKLQVKQIEGQRKQIEIERKKAEELTKVTVESYEKKLVEVNGQIETLKSETASIQAELKKWRQRAIIAEAAKLSQPFPKRYQPVADEKALPRVAFEGQKTDPSPETGETQISEVLREGFPIVVITAAKLDSKENVRHVEAVVCADLVSPWPQGAKMKFRVDFTGKEGQPAAAPTFVVRYYDVSDMDEIDETTGGHWKRALFTIEENKVAGYEVSAFLVKTQ